MGGEVIRSIRRSFGFSFFPGIGSTVPSGNVNIRPIRTNLTDTIIAPATPPGVGAIAVLRLSGPRAIELVNAAFSAKDLSRQKSHTVHYGTLRDQNHALLDEVLVTLFVAPRSYTGEEVVEISCHGSDYIVRRLLEYFVDAGARFAQPGEFTLRAFLNGRMDLSQAEAVADLIASQSAGSHEVALRQLRGGFRNEIQALRERLIHFASLIELELDFGEEDVEFADRTELRELVEQLLARIRQLLDSFRLGNALRRGISTVIAGRPNAGKSTLLNALLNEERAIVSDVAGTTRDTIEEPLVIEGIEFRLIDTAGIRDARDQIEAIGVQRTLEKVRTGRLLVYVYDVNELGPETVRADLEQLRNEHDGDQAGRVLVVGNQTDRYAGTPPIPTDDPTILMSALQQTQLDELRAALLRVALDGKTSLDQTLVTNTRHYEALRRAATSLQDVLRGLADGITGDFVAMDIRQALHHLGEITGEVSSDDLLDRIFRDFCIGK